MKSFTRTIKQGFALIAALLFVCTVRAQFTPGNFVVAYTFPDGTSDIQFYAQTAGGPVTYSFQVYNNGVATGSSGSGSFTGSGTNSPVSIASTITSGKLTLNAGDSIVISYAPANLRWYATAYTLASVIASATNLTDVLQWGNVPWNNMLDMFFSCSTLITNFSATDMPDVSAVTSMMSIFFGASAFNGNIGNWNTANVTNMRSVFRFDTAFNQDIGGWNTAKVTTMLGTFVGATAFNQDISSWNTGNVTTMQSMFADATAFNQNIGSWNTAKVTDMSYMFQGAISFNQNLNGWNTGNVTTMGSMFADATAFNQNLSKWNTANVTDMSYMFNETPVFNQDLSGWNTAKVTNMDSMFAGASTFNQNISAWNTAKVTNMDGMFADATSFNQNLGSWNLSSVSSMENMLDNSGMDCTNYSLTLQGWAANLGKTTPANITLGAAGLSYSNDAATVEARAALVAAGWTITDNGSESCPVTTASPVTWLNFTAQKQGNTALLQWQMATESNNKGFAVQRSSDGQNWQTIGFVNSKAANGNSAQPLSYQYTDNAPLSGINYYRLQQQDLDGNIGYSSVANINFGVLQTLIHPNPASTQFTVTVGANSNFQLINVGGSIVLKGILKAGDNTINVSSLADGVYVLRVVTGNSVKTYEVLVRK